MTSKMVALTHERAHLDEPGACGVEFAERRHLPGEVVEAECALVEGC